MFNHSSRKKEDKNRFNFKKFFQKNKRLKKLSLIAMYNIPYFKENNQEEVIGFIQKQPFALVTGCSLNSKPVATQLPLLLEKKNDKIFLCGHLMKATDHHKAFIENQNVLCVFTGPHTYVSATWYSDPHQASTWNYISVHVRGVIKFLDDNALVDVLKKTTLHFENNNHESSTVFENLPNDYCNRLMKAIVPFEIEVLEIDNVFKLSQNRDKESYSNIIEKLKEQGGDGILIAGEMEKRKAERGLL
jgi:transcriptional regulator